MNRTAREIGALFVSLVLGTAVLAGGAPSPASVARVLPAIVNCGSESPPGNPDIRACYVRGMFRE